MPEEGRELVHASKLRHYQSRLSTVGVMFDDDRAFGEADYAPRPTDERSTGMVLPESMTAHLEGRARADIRAVFAAHQGLFKDKPGMVKVRKHFILLEEGFAPKSCRPYRVPAALHGRWTSRSMSSLKET